MILYRYEYLLFARPSFCSKQAKSHQVPGDFRAARPEMDCLTYDPYNDVRLDT